VQYTPVQTSTHTTLLHAPTYGHVMVDVADGGAAGHHDRRVDTV